MNCPNCGSAELEANTWEAWCYDCDRQWTKEHDPDIYEQIRTATRQRPSTIKEPTRIHPIELRARREALGLSQESLGRAFGVKQNTVSQWESGARQVPLGVDDELAHLEKVSLQLSDRMIENARDGDVLIVHADDTSLTAAHPEMEGTPASVHRVAAGRALAELRDAGVIVRIVSSE